MPGPVHLCRCRADGRTSMVMVVDVAIREALGLLPRDVIGFRVVTIQGKKMIIGEKVGLDKIAVLANLPVEALPTER